MIDVSNPRIFPRILALQFRQRKTLARLKKRVRTEQMIATRLGDGDFDDRKRGQLSLCMHV